jgi:hypothetical protein
MIMVSSEGSFAALVRAVLFTRPEVAMVTWSCGRASRAGVLSVAAVLGCGMTGGIAAAGSGSAAHPPGWRVRLMGIPPLSARPSAFIAGLAAVSPADAWGAGLAPPFSPVIDRWNGTRWRRITLPRPAARLLGASSFIVTVSASSRRNVWMFSQTLREAESGSSHGIWLRYDGTRWTWGKINLPGSFVSDLLSVGGHGVWAFGNMAGRRVYAWYHIHGGWTRVRLPGHLQVGDAAAVTASDLWALETTGENPGPAGALLHLAHGRWRLIPLPRIMRHGGAISLVACGPDCAVVGGSVRNRRGGTSPALGRWNGRHWTVTTLPAPADASSDTVWSLVTAGPGGLLATTGGTNQSPAPSRLWQYWHGRWIRVPLTARHLGTLTLMAPIPGSTSVWAEAGHANHFKLALLSRLP